MNHSRFRAAGAVLIMLLISPLAIAAESHWQGTGPLPGASSGRTLTGWEVPDNATMLDAWLQVSNDQISDISDLEIWTVSDQPGNFSTGTTSDAVIDTIEQTLHLDYAPGSGFTEDFENLERQLPNELVAAGMNGSLWEPVNLSAGGTISANGSQAIGSGWGPGSGTAGDWVIASNPGADLPPGASLNLESAPIPLDPANKSNLIVEFELAYHLFTDSDTAGHGDGAWVEISYDNGTSWNWIEPLGGYNNTISSIAPVPNGASGPGFGVWASINYTSWTPVRLDIANQTIPPNASHAAFRLQVWSSYNSPSTRPGIWFDEFSVRVGSEPGTWFVGNTNGGYQNNEDASMYYPMDLSSVSNNTSLTLGMGLWWDLEGSSYDNLRVYVSKDNTTWTEVSSSGGIPGNSGLSVNSTTYFGESGGWVWFSAILPTGYAGDSSTWLKVNFQTDGSVTYGGGIIDGWEGALVDDVRVYPTSGGNPVVDEAFTSPSYAWHSPSTPTGSDEWQHLTTSGRGVLISYVENFENLAISPQGGWAILNQATDGWEIGAPDVSTYGPPSGPASGSNVVGVNLDGAYGSSQVATLTTPSIMIPTGSSATLSFNHWMCSENGYDAGTIFIEGNQSGRTHLNGTTGFYETTFTGINPTYNGLDVWDGSTHTAGPFGSCQQHAGGWANKNIRLSQWGGEEINVVFEFWSDSIISYDGWYLDDIALTLERFLPTGTWTSQLISVSELGSGFVDVEADIPAGTWVGLTVLDAGGVPISGFENLSMPASLANMDLDMNPQIQLRLEMGTNTVSLTPQIYNLTYGSARALRPSSTSANGWTTLGGLSYNSTTDLLENTAASAATITADYVASSRPISAINIEGRMTGTSVDILDRTGQVLASRSSGIGAIRLQDPVPGYAVRFNLGPSGNIGEARLNGTWHLPALNASIDIANDGSEEWSFPADPSRGHLGWQNRIHASSSLGGTTVPYPTMARSASISAGPAAPASIEVIIPENATLREAWVAVNANIPAGETIDVNVGLSPLATLSSGTGGTTLLWLGQAHINAAHAATASIDASGRSMRTVSITFTSSISQTISIPSVMFSYDYSENLTAILDPLRAARSAGLGTDPIELAVHVASTQGSIGIDGEIMHEVLLIDQFIHAPAPLVPNRSLYTATSNHIHLFDPADIQSIDLEVQAPDGRTAATATLSEPYSSPSFSQTAGFDLIVIDPNASSVSPVPGMVGDLAVTQFQVDWVFSVPWEANDSGVLSWKATSFNRSGYSVDSPGYVSGSPSAPALENDLEIDTFFVHRSDGMQVAIGGDPFHISPSQVLNLSGTLRFEGLPTLVPNGGDVQLIVVMGEDAFTIPVKDDGTWDGLVTVPSDILDTIPQESFILLPNLANLGGLSGGLGAEDVTDSARGIEAVLDHSSPVLSALNVQLEGQFLAADGFVWDPDDTLDIHLTIEDPEALGPKVTLHMWREGIDGNGDAEAGEYTSISKDLQRAGRSGVEELVFRSLDISSMPTNGRLSLWFEANDESDRTLQNGGGPGFDNDAATLLIATNEPTTIRADLSILNGSVGGWIPAGQPIEFGLALQDANGVESLDRIDVYFAGLTGDETGHLVFEPIHSRGWAEDESGISVQRTWFENGEEDVGIAWFEMTLDWDMALGSAIATHTPVISITDTGSDTIDGIELTAINWKLDRTLELKIEDMRIFGQPDSSWDGHRMQVKPGARLAIDGSMQFSQTGLKPHEYPPNLTISGDLDYPNDPIEKIAQIGSNGTFTVTIPMHNYSLPPESSIVDLFLHGETTAEKVAFVMSAESEIHVDSKAPILTISSNLANRLPSDGLDSISIEVRIREAGLMKDGLRLMYQVERTNGIIVPLIPEQLDLPLLGHIGDEWTYAKILNLNPKDHIWEDGDLLIIWFEGSDAAGWGLDAVQGSSSKSPIRVAIEVAIYDLSFTGLVVEPDSPVAGDPVKIQVLLENTGNRESWYNITLLETNPDGSVDEIESLNITLIKSGRMPIELTYETYQAGTPILSLKVEMPHNGSFELTLDMPNVASASRQVASASASAMTSIVGLVVVILFVVTALIVVILRKEDEDDDGDEDVWADAVPALEAEMWGAHVGQNVPTASSPPPPPNATSSAPTAELLSHELTLNAEQIKTYMDAGWSAEQLREHYRQID